MYNISDYKLRQRRIKVNRKLKKFLCVFLSILIVVQILPMNVLARDITQNQAIQNVDTSSVDNNSDEIVINDEIESMRTENSKTFLTDDNGYYQITSFLPIHDYDNGEWVDKSDLNFSVETVEEAETYVEAQTTVLLNENDSYTAGSNTALSGNDASEDITNDDETGETNDQVTTTITSDGDIYTDNCQTVIGTYSSTGANDLSVIYARSGKTTKRSEIYIKPNFPTDHAIFVTDAKIKAGIYDENIDGEYNLVEVNQIKADWTAGTQSVRLNTENSANYDLVEIYSDGEDSENLITYNFDFTNYCNYTRIGLISNYGVALMANELGTNLTFENLTVEMYYHEIEDVDSGFEHEQIDMGRSGMVYINDYTCSPTLVRDELSLYGEISPVTIQTVFNPMADIDDNGLGIHTRLNYYSTLIYDSTSNLYLWKNCEGENLYFEKKIGSSTVFTATGADDVIYTLYLTGSDYSNYGNILIKDSNDKEYKFSSYSSKGYLTEIYDGSENNNCIVIEYATIGNNKYNISSVTDGIGRKYILTYSNGYLSKLHVLNSDGDPIYISSETATGETNTPIEINYSYQNGLLQQITYADGKTVQYTYGNDEKFSTITNIDGSKINFTYESKFDKESYKLSEYIKVDSNNNNQETVEIESIDGSIYNRAFSSNLYSSNKKLTFDHWFNMISMQSYDGIEYFLNYSNGELQYILTSEEEENFITNGDFESVSDGRPTGWQYETTDNSNISQNIIASGDNTSNRTMCMDNFMDTCRAYQTIEPDNYTFSTDKSYIISGSIYRNDNPISISETRDLCIYVYDTKLDDNGAIVPDTCLTKMDFDDTLGEEWQQRKTIFTPVKNTTSLIVYLSYNNMMYTCDFDDIKMYEATTQNAIKATEIIPSNDISYDYSENNSILEEIKTTVDGDVLGTFYNYTDDENYVNKITNNGVTTYYNYDEENGLLLSKGKNSDSSKNAQYSYTAVGLLEHVKQISTQIDGTSVNINTNYSYENDRIKTVEHNGFLYEYEYDSSGRVIGVSEYPLSSTEKNQLVTYNYNNNKVDTITYGNGAKTIYEYNQLGYITKIIHIPAADETISANDENVPELESIVYEYTYDEYGNMLSYTDNSNNTITTIEDGIYTIKEQGEEGAIIYQNNGSIKNFYGVKTSLSNPTISTSSGKTTNTRIFSLLGDSVLPSNVITATTVYDSVGRTFKTTSTDKSAVVENECTYVNSGIKTSNLIDTYISSVKKVSTSNQEPRIYRKITYTYNDRGQITDVYRASVNNIPENVEGTSTSVNQLKNELLKHYEYDEAGQVILDVNFDSCIAIKYKYNSGGNLVSKTIYENDNSDDKSAFYYKKSTGKYVFNDEKAEVINYGYSSNWGDVLTSFNGETITYDEIGNPINYVGQSLAGEDISGTMTWDGNRLTSFDDGETKYVYKYTADGYRTQKISYDSDNPNQIKSKMDYVYQDDTLIGYRTLTYSYDSVSQSSRPQNEFITSIVYNSTDEAVGLDVQSTGYNYTDSNGETTVTTDTTRTYFYLLRDGQGNITDLYSSDESLVMHFSYDAYGICTISFSGTSIEAIKDQMENTSAAWEKLLMAFLLTLLFSAAAGGTLLATQQTYRGYVCDYETGLYYSQNRFYSPAWGRFINADDSNIMLNNQEDVFNANLFNYCNNDPVNNIDLSGYAPTSYDTANNILSALNITQLNTIQVGIVTSNLLGKVRNEMTVFSLSLSTVKDPDDKKYWNRVFGTTENTVKKSNGNNYMESIVSKQSGAVTMYNVKSNNSPYKIGE